MCKEIKNETYKFKNNLLTCSESNELSEATKEWISIHQEKRSEYNPVQCICSRKIYAHVNYLINIKNGKSICVGEGCEKHFECKDIIKNKYINKAAKIFSERGEYTDIEDLDAYCKAVKEELFKLLRNELERCNNLQQLEDLLKNIEDIKTIMFNSPKNTELDEIIKKLQDRIKIKKDEELKIQQQEEAKRQEEEAKRQQEEEEEAVKTLVKYIYNLLWPTNKKLDRADRLRANIVLKIWLSDIRPKESKEFIEKEVLLRIKNKRKYWEEAEKFWDYLTQIKHSSDKQCDISWA
tara:strand:+ start:1479 stop:2360 length:882 start_codon:yes stop_codon:yes gene_type:complete